MIVNKEQYLRNLRRMLGRMREDDRNEILYDYEEHFRIGTENGKTEEEIAESLGDVKTIARQFIADYSVKQAEENTSAGNILKAVFAAGALGFFNLIFVLGPFIGLVGVLVGLFAAAFGLSIGGFAALVGVIISPLFPSFINLNGVDIGFILFSSAGVMALGLLFLIGVFYLAKFLYKGTVRYLKWNIEVIKK